MRRRNSKDYSKQAVDKSMNRKSIWFTPILFWGGLPQSMIWYTNQFSEYISIFDWVANCVLVSLKCLIASNCHKAGFHTHNIRHTGFNIESIQIIISSDYIRIFFHILVLRKYCKYRLTVYLLCYHDENRQLIRNFIYFTVHMTFFRHMLCATTDFYWLAYSMTTFLILY